MEILQASDFAFREFLASNNNEHGQIKNEELREIFELRDSYKVLLKEFLNKQGYDNTDLFKEVIEKSARSLSIAWTLQLNNSKIATKGNTICT